MSLGTYTFTVKPERDMIVEVKEKLGQSREFLVESVRSPTTCLVRPVRPGQRFLGTPKRRTTATKN